MLVTVAPLVANVMAGRHFQFAAQLPLPMLWKALPSMNTSSMFWNMRNSICSPGVSRKILFRRSICAELPKFDAPLK